MNSHGGKRNGAGRLPGIKTKFSPEAVQRRIARIQVGAIIDKLEGFVASAPKDDLKQTHLSAAGLLLDRVAPRLSATELSGQVAHPTVIRSPDVSTDSKAWLDRHAPAVVDVEPKPKPGEVN